MCNALECRANRYCQAKWQTELKGGILRLTVEEKKLVDDVISRNACDNGAFLESFHGYNNKCPVVIFPQPQQK